MEIRKTPEGKEVTVPPDCTDFEEAFHPLLEDLRDTDRQKKTDDQEAHDVHENAPDSKAS